MTDPKDDQIAALTARVAFLTEVCSAMGKASERSLEVKVALVREVGRLQAVVASFADPLPAASVESGRVFEDWFAWAYEQISPNLTTKLYDEATRQIHLRARDEFGDDRAAAGWAWFQRKMGWSARPLSS